MHLGIHTVWRGSGSQIHSFKIIKTYILNWVSFPAFPLIITFYFIQVLRKRNEPGTWDLTAYNHEAKLSAGPRVWMFLKRLPIKAISQPSLVLQRRLSFRNLSPDPLPACLIQFLILNLWGRWHFKTLKNQLKIKLGTIGSSYFWIPWVYLPVPYSVSFLLLKDPRLMGCNYENIGQRTAT